MTAATSETLSISELTERRAKTEAVAAWMRQRLERQLDTLRPAFDPRRLYGRHAGTPIARAADVSGSDAAVAQLTQRFQALVGAPFSLRAELPPEAVSGIDANLELYPLEYSHVAEAGGERKPIRMTAPLRWVMSYASGYTLPQLDRVLMKQEERREKDMRQFLVNSLALGAMFERFPALAQLLGDLRFRVETVTRDGLGKLPLVTVAAELQSVRPPDDLILTITGVSGVAAFIEVLPREPLAALVDPMRSEVARLIE